VGSMVTSGRTHGLSPDVAKKPQVRVLIYI